jgi:acyl-CoA thioesterase-1
MRCGFIRVLSLWLALGCWGSAQAATLLVMGDSLSAGYGIKVENGWVALLSKRLSTQGYGYQVVNASVSGETSGGGKVRLPGLLKTHKPELVIIELGANDGLRGLPVKQLRSNLAAMITAVQASKARVLLLGMQIPTNYGEQYASGFANTYNELAKSYRVVLVPTFIQKVALDASLMQGDNLHPNERGQPLLLDTVWPQLQTMLKR